MHESDAIPAPCVIQLDLVAGVLEPFNLVPADTVHATRAHAVATAGAEEPDSSLGLLWVDGVLDGHLVSKLVVHRLAVEIVEVWQRG